MYAEKIRDEKWSTLDRGHLLNIREREGRPGFARAERLEHDDRVNTSSKAARQVPPTFTDRS